MPYQIPKEPALSRPPTGSLKEVGELPFYAPKNLTLEDLEEALLEERRDRLEGLL